MDEVEFGWWKQAFFGALEGQAQAVGELAPGGPGSGAVLAEYAEAIADAAVERIKAKNATVVRRDP